MNRITTHPGEVLKEELEARGMSQKKFSELLNVPYTQLNEILNGKRPVTTDFALMMEAALGINPELLIKPFLVRLGTLRDIPHRENPSFFLCPLRFCPAETGGSVSGAGQPSG